MSDEIVLFPTFDYELFLGRNFGTPEEVLFEPTRRLFDSCRELGIPITLFADICSVWAHRDHGKQAYADGFESQLREAISVGHDVQLHVHPHWLFASPHGEQWDISEDRMYLSELGFDDSPTSAPSVIERGVRYLEDLLRAVSPSYRCMAFRAAALAMQPREGELVRALLDAGIAVDMSIAKDLVLTMDTVSVDYRGMPASASWHIDPNRGLAVSSSAGLLEVPIATFEMPLTGRLEFLLRRARSIGNVRGAGISRATHQSRLANLKTLVLGNLRYLGGRPRFLLSADTKGFDVEMLLDGFDQYVRAHPGERVMASMIGHPKLMFEDQQQLFARFVDGARRKYGKRLRFAAARDALAAS